MTAEQAAGEPQPKAAAGSPAPEGPAAPAHDDGQQQQANGTAGGPREAGGGGGGDQQAAGDGTRPAASAEDLAAQFQAQMAALAALAMDQVAPEATVLAACGGRVPAAAAAELAEAAAAFAKRGANGCAAREQRGAAGPGGAQQDPDSEGERLRAAIRAKMRRLAPQQERVRQAVLEERRLATEVTDSTLLDWRRLRRPLPDGIGPPRSRTGVPPFEPPLQPAALLQHQQAARAATAAKAARAEREALQRRHLQRQQQPQQAQAAADGSAALPGQAADSSGQLPAPMHFNPFMRGGGGPPLEEQQQQQQQQQASPAMTAAAGTPPPQRSPGLSGGGRAGGSADGAA